MLGWNDGRRRPSGKKDESLAQYARWEYGPGNEAWLMASLKEGERTARSGGVRRRLASVRRRTEASPTSDGFEPATPCPDAAHRTAPDGGVLLVEAVCEHEDLEHLGEGGSAVYLRCKDCGTFLISQAGSLWILQSEGRGPGE